MQKLLITTALSASLLITACSSVQEATDAVPDYLAELPLMYRPTIQQGNVLEQEQINQLKPGMARRQVQYLLGTPVLVDVFHQNRWDYHYTLKPNAKPMEQKRLTLYFEDDRLVRMEGDFRPQPINALEEADKKETVVDVPDHEPIKKGFVTRALETVGISLENDTAPAE